MEEEEETAIEFKENSKETEGTSQTCFSDHVYLYNNVVLAMTMPI
jgi:hypothetical protein